MHQWQRLYESTILITQWLGMTISKLNVFWQIHRLHSGRWQGKFASFWQRFLRNVCKCTAKAWIHHRHRYTLNNVCLTRNQTVSIDRIRFYLSRLFFFPTVAPAGEVRIFLVGKPLILLSGYFKTISLVWDRILMQFFHTFPSKRHKSKYHK